MPMGCRVPLSKIVRVSIRVRVTFFVVAITYICDQRQRLSAEKFRKKCGAALSLHCLMCGKCAANLVDSAANIFEICGKRAAN